MNDVSQPVPDRDVSGSRRPGPRRAARIVCLVLVGLLLLLAVAWLNRRAAARELLIGWLDRRGVDADIRIDRIELDGLTARVRIGDPRNPDVTVERVEVDYAVGMPWSRAGLGLTPSRIRLVRPVARVSYRDGKLSFGSLDPLIQEFLHRPPRPETRAPLILVESGRVRLSTDYGAAEINADARVDNGKLMRLQALMPATTLGSRDLAARDLTAVVDLTTVGDRITGRIGLAAKQGHLAGVSGDNLRGEIVADLPYPDFKTRKGDGRADLHLTMTGDRWAVGNARIGASTLRADFTGQTSGWLDTFHISGLTSGRLRAASLSGSAATASGLGLDIAAARTTVTRAADGLSWRLDGAASAGAARAAAGGVSVQGLTVRSGHLSIGGRGAAFEAQGPVAVGVDDLAWGDLGLTGARFDGDLDVVSDAGVNVEATGAMQATRGRWPLFGPHARDDIPELAAMKTALDAFAVDVPGLALRAGSDGTRLVLSRPATLRPANGGVLTLQPVSRPLFEAAPGQAGGGALNLVARRGAGLPEMTVSIPAWRLTPGGFSADLDGRAALDFGLARGITLRTRGQLASDRGRLTYRATGCTPLTVERLELGENDVTALSGDFCPTARPMVSVANGGWRAEGALRGVDASAPFLALEFKDARGQLIATGNRGGVGLETRVDSALVVDATRPRRFNALTATGTARLADESWTGDFTLGRGEAALGRMTLAHDGRSGVGGVRISAPGVVFAPDGLQPDDLSPMAAALVKSPATGSIAFEGRLDWTADQPGTSSGRLTIPALDFTSPAGPVKGLKGAIDFSSLAPLTAEPGQHLTIDRIETFVPLTDIAVLFGLDKAAVTLSEVTLAAAGGTVRIEPVSVPLTPGQPITGAIDLETIQLGELVAGAGFGDKVQLDAVVSGRLPFTSDAEHGWRITGGTLHAVQPGRLSIQREALSGLQAGGGGESVPPNTVQDLAYQAMENLAFNDLSAEVNSLDGGRLSVLFHIKGRHDPPEHQELRLSLSELISRKFLNRPLPLPSDTGIDLTLDTTLNINQLVEDLLALNRARAGQAADPSPSEPAP